MTEPNENNNEEADAPRDNDDGHLPEWQRIFGELRDEAEKLYPDGRVKVLVPGRTRRRRPESKSERVSRLKPI